MDARVKVVVVVILALAAFVGFCVYQNMKRKQQLIRRIKRSWGQRPVREYSHAEFGAISHYYLLKEKTSGGIDDITWNDLDMDTVFMLLNHTWSCVGESYLYAMLRTPQMEEEKLLERDRLATYLIEHPQEREQLEMFFAGVGKTGSYSIFDYIYNLADFEPGSNLVHYIGIGLLVASIGCIVAIPQIGILAFLGALGYCWSTYAARRKKVEPYVMSCTSLLLMLRMADKVGKMQIPEIDGYLKAIVEAKKAFAKFKRNSFFFVAGGNQNEGGGLAQSLAVYINFTFHADLIQFKTLVNELKKNIPAFESLTDNLGELESAVAIASFRTMMEEQCRPQLSADHDGGIEIADVYHPLIDEPVKNSIAVKHSVLLTGSNASGKSTFLKTVAINAVLAQTIYTCLATKYKSGFYQIYSSMALRDDLLSQESYYIVEIKSLKRILDRVGGKYPIMCFVDEVLRGTNTVERIAASSQILKSMGEQNVLCFAATHDIELTHILEGVYENYHFQEEVDEDNIYFDYKLYQGRATSRNAIKLLAMIGYQKEIINKAEEAAEHFVASGEWRLE